MANSQQNRQTTWAATTVVGFFLLIVYLVFPSRQLDPDILPELLIIMGKAPNVADPAHLLYPLLGSAWYQVLTQVGLRMEVIEALQWLNAGLAALSIACLHYMMSQHLAIRTSIAIPIALCAGLSYGFWTHSIDAFFIIPAAFLAVLSLVLAYHLRSGWSWPAALGLGLSIGLGVTAFQVNALLVPALMAASWHGTAKTSRVSWLSRWVVIGLVAALSAGTLLGWQANVRAGVRSPVALMEWYLGGHGGMENGLWRREGVGWILPVVTAWVATVVPLYEGMRLRKLLEGQISAPHLPAQLALFLLAAALTLAGRALLRPEARQRLQPHGPTFLLWILIPGLAVWWFDRAEVKLWIIPSLISWCALALLLEAATARRGRNSYPLMAAMLACGLALGNFTLAVWPASSRPSRGLTQASAFSVGLHPGDLVISAFFDWTAYLPLTCPKCRSLNLVGLAQAAQGDRRNTVLAGLREAQTRALATGGKVYVVSRLAHPSEQDFVSWLQPFTGLTAADLTQLSVAETPISDGSESLWRLR